MGRQASVTRQTKETHITCHLELDGTGKATVSTGLPFLDHMLDALVRHSRIDLELKAQGDLEVDDHHTVEDTALTLGKALEDALGDRSGIQRFGHAYAPLDEALARAVIDLSGRPFPVIDLGLKREMIGQVACENLTHFFQSLAFASRMSLHVDVLKGDNDHHRVEAAFKAAAIALREAVKASGTSGVPSTKGALG
ncbi:MAG: imidazoleglycerol-phosphate dehydratase HisB [Myxococcota bacterium]|nr:imidazoleglycerol-phosphate dehydratase HisB [Myxococcota bacterium]